MMSFGLVERARAIKLGNGQISHMPPVSTPVVAFIDAAIVAGQQMVGVGGVNPERVIIHMSIVYAHTGPGLAAIFLDLHPGIHGINPVRIMRVDDQLIIILG